MKSTITLLVDIEHEDNLAGDARSIAADVAERVFDNFVAESGPSRVGVTPDGRGSVVEFAGNRVLAYIQSAVVETVAKEVV